jgi:hypothetical protein
LRVCFSHVFQPIFGFLLVTKDNEHIAGQFPSNPKARLQRIVRRSIAPARLVAPTAPTTAGSGHLSGQHGEFILHVVLRETIGYSCDQLRNLPLSSPA